MSPINSALQYKIQKMEKQLSSLMEENAVLKRMISEASGPVGAFMSGGGAGLGAYLAAQPNVGVSDQPNAAMGSRTGPVMSNTQRSGGPGVAASMAAPGTNPGNQVPAFDGAMLGQLLAQAGEDGGAAAANYLAQFGVQIPFAGGMDTASGTRRGNPLSRTRR